MDFPQVAARKFRACAKVNSLRHRRIEDHGREGQEQPLHAAASPSVDQPTSASMNKLLPVVGRDSQHRVAETPSSIFRQHMPLHHLHTFATPPI